MGEWLDSYRPSHDHPPAPPSPVQLLQWFHVPDQPPPHPQLQQWQPAHISDGLKEILVHPNDLPD